DEELRVTEGLDRTHRQNDLFPGSFRGTDLPVQLCRIEFPRLRFYAVPVRTQTDQRIWIVQQRAQGGTFIEAKRRRLEGSEADTEHRRAARFDRMGTPGLGQWSRRALDTQLHRLFPLPLRGSVEGFSLSLRGRVGWG